MKRRMLAICMAGGLMLGMAACGESTPAQQSAQGQENITVVIDGQEYGAGLLLGEVEGEMDSDPDREIERAPVPIAPCFGTKLDGTVLGEEFYFYRSTLDDTAKQAYDQLRGGILEGKAAITMTVPVTKEDIFDIYKKVIYDGADLFWAETNGARYRYNKSGLVTEFHPGYNDLAAEREANQEKLEAAAAEALADLWSLPTQVEQVKYAHDYLTHTVTYDLNAPYTQTAYSALVNGRSVCAGYSHAFQYLMQKMGIPCAFMLGGANGGYHAWNQVKLGEEFYAMDVTWDDPLGSPPDKYYYNYFNITDDTISATHTRMEISSPIPWARGTAFSYQNAFVGDAYGTDFDAIVGVMPQVEENSPPPADNPYLG